MAIKKKKTRDKAVMVRLSPSEYDEIEKKLEAENNKTCRADGLGTKLRELGLMWARGK